MAWPGPVSRGSSETHEEGELHQASEWPLGKKEIYEAVLLKQGPLEETVEQVAAEIPEEQVAAEIPE